MKVTHFGQNGFPWAHVANFGGTGNVITIGSNTNTDPPLSALNFVQRITSNGSNALLNPLVNFAAGSNIYFTLDQGPLPAQAYPSNTLRIHSTGGGGGNIITANGSNSLAAVVNLVAGTGIALGVSGQNLTITNTSPGPGGGTSPALVLLEQHTASSSASLDFTSFLSATYDEYLVEGVNVVPVTDAVVFKCQVGTGGGPTYDTGSNYFNIFRANGSSSGTASDSGALTGITICKKLGNTAAFGEGSFNMRMTALQSSSLDKHFWGECTYHEGLTGGAEQFVATLGGIWASTTAVTAVRFLMSSGNIASGIIRIYGIAK